MLLAVIVGCEVAFWVLLGAGLLYRYRLGRRRLGGILLAAVPAVDLVLLLVAVLDLRTGGDAALVHGLAALYLGFSVVFGPAMVRWADVRTAYRFAGGPPPADKPRSGSWARARLEWREFGKGVLAAALSTALLLGAVLLVGDHGDTTALWAWPPRLGVLLGGWLLAWPAWDTVRAVLRQTAP